MLFVHMTKTYHATCRVNRQQWINGPIDSALFPVYDTFCISGHHNIPSLQWRHNEHDGVLNHRRFHCLLNCWLRRRSKKTSKLRLTGLCAGNSAVTSEFPAQKASDAENVSIWWRHHDPLLTDVPSTCCIHVEWMVERRATFGKLSLFAHVGTWIFEPMFLFSVCFNIVFIVGR